MEDGFIRGRSDNLPKVNIFTIMDYFSKIKKNTHGDNFGRRSLNGVYGDDAVKYVQIKRNDNLCTVKCVISINTIEQHNCTVLCNENLDKIEFFTCDCEQEFCIHIVVLVLWLHRRSEEPESILVKHYWPDENLKQDKFIKLKDMFPKSSHEDEIESDVEQNILEEFVKTCHEKNIQCPIMSYFREPDQYEKMSLHLLMCEFRNEVKVIDADKFIEYCQKNISTVACQTVAEATVNHPVKNIIAELCYGRILASQANAVVSGIAHDEAFIEQIVGCCEFDQETYSKNKSIKNKVIPAVEKILKININPCGIFLCKEHIMMAACPDGVTAEHVIEIKLGNKKNRKAYIQNGKLSSEIVIEMQLQMHLANKDKGYICIVDENSENSKYKIDLIKVQYNKQYCIDYVKDCEKYWKENIFKLINLE